MTQPTVSAVLAGINKAAEAQRAVQDAAKLAAAQIADERAAASTLAGQSATPGGE